MTSFSLVLFSFPNYFIEVFSPDDPKVDFTAVSALGAQLLYFVAAYSILDAGNIVFSSALKGAGDTRSVLIIMLIVAILTLVIPSYVACVWFGAGIMTAWFILTGYVIILAFCFYGRYRAGYWRSMRVIEHVPVPGVAVPTDGPLGEL
jgi:MATE family multidrug resistance protein